MTQAVFSLASKRRGTSILLESTIPGITSWVTQRRLKDKMEYNFGFHPVFLSVPQMPSSDESTYALFIPALLHSLPRSTLVPGNVLLSPAGRLILVDHDMKHCPIGVPSPQRYIVKQPDGPFSSVEMPMRMLEGAPLRQLATLPLPRRIRRVNYSNHWLLAHNLKLPATFAESHSGLAHHSYHSPDGKHGTRIDYVAVPQETQYDDADTLGLQRILISACYEPIIMLFYVTVLSLCLHPHKDA